MNTAVDKYYPGLRSDATSWGESDVMAWVSGLLLEAGIRAGGLAASSTPTAAEVVQGLDSLKGDTLGGMAPPLTFAAGKPHPVDCWFTTRLKSGVPSLVNGDKATCESGAS